MARKEKSIHYIYKTICNVTGRWYVGMHSTSNENDGYMGSGKRLRYSIRKYGVEQHTKEIIEYCNSREELVLREMDIVTNELISDELCMNLKCGGTGGISSEEHHIKMREGASKSVKEKWKCPEYKKKINSLALERLFIAHKEGKIKYDTFTGKNHSEETKKLMSQQRKGIGQGEANSQYGTCWITKDGLNKKIKKEDFEQWFEEGWLKGRK